MSEVEAWQCTPPAEVERHKRARHYGFEIKSSKEHCAHCFDVLLAHFDGLDAPKPAIRSGAVCPLFVTWKKRTTRSGSE